MRLIAVVPAGPERKLMLKAGKPIGDHDDPSCALGLERADQPLDDGGAAVLAEGTEPMADAPPPAPTPEGARRELDASIRDEVRRTCTDVEE